MYVSGIGRRQSYTKSLKLMRCVVLVLPGNLTRRVRLLPRDGMGLSSTGISIAHLAVQINICGFILAGR